MPPDLVGADGFLRYAQFDAEADLRHVPFFPQRLNTVFHSNHPI